MFLAYERFEQIKNIHAGVHAELDKGAMAYKRIKDQVSEYRSSSFLLCVCSVLSFSQRYTPSSSTRLSTRSTSPTLSPSTSEKEEALSPSLLCNTSVVTPSLSSFVTVPCSINVWAFQRIFGESESVRREASKRSRPSQPSRSPLLFLLSTFEVS